ncbi:ubiquitin domain containing protein [Acanthamoeba castellanii str. Neff]|uniref:ubiquitinyl hydrolase 1 n=1 Tax=Acanthamoeba castellanii (strain ATCC 30010 / Neff) TaxID=1257118 RepID=L8GTI1_ACACF|nr:ubiquitin domain containing protein [Acanthamoeba castellanii str. Neff]ELR16489.1 ubiquitin domain containing protein [Acanthamoeba castellanii str. Neff]
MEGVHSEEDLQQTHITQIYHLGDEPCSEEGHGADNCEDNPNCLLGLGEGGEGVWAECPPTIEELGNDPHAQVKQPDVPAGLENLGATCYMNNVLQCLYMNTAFRQAKGKEKQLEADAQQAVNEKEEHSRGSVCSELQRLFALMQEGRRSFYTPKRLTEALNLKTSIQQDAQEFYKLFLDYLEERFQQSEDESIKELVGQFQGEYAYTTVCQACKTVSQRKCQFSELELNLKLTDSNQYFCETCSKLQDATRSIVLNLQLMRFVYDIKTFQKRKLQDSIAFPLEIDMGKYMQEFDERQNEVENKRRRKGLAYELVGVLIHVGPGANVGHYIAHTRDEVTKKWWRFDDAVVTPLDEAKIGIEKEPKKNKKKGAALPEGMTESSNSYMLIYALKDRETVAQPQLPASAQAFVDIDNREFEKQIEEYDMKAKEERERIEAHKQSYTAHFSTLGVPPGTKEYNWIAVSWLRQWVIGSKELPPIDNTELMCAHDMLDPRKLSHAKRITPEAWSMLQSQFKGGPVLSQECYCMPCSAALCHELAKDAEYNRMKETTLNLITAGPAPKGYILSTSWLNQKSEPEDLSKNMNEKITCEHGNLCPAGGRRVVPAQAWSWLRSEFPEGAEFHSSESACKECIRDSAANKEELQNLKVVKAKEKVLFPARIGRRKDDLTVLSLREEQRRVNAIANEKDAKPGCRYYIISQEWFGRWRAWVENVPDTDEPSPIANESLFPIDPDETEFRLVTPELWAKLIKRKVVDRPIVLQVERQDGGELVFRVDPATCLECTEARQNAILDQQYNYEEAEIVVTTKRRTPAVKTDKITVSADDTILVVKLKILEKLEIEPNEQALFFNDVELKDSKATLRQFKVPAKATIFIERRQLSMADYDILDGHDQIEEGFKGTIFSHEKATDASGREEAGASASPSPSRAEAEDLPAEVAKLWTCDVCTFHNPYASPAAAAASLIT